MGAHDPPSSMLRTKIFENRCDVLIIMRDVLITTRDVLIIMHDVLIITREVLIIMCDVLIIMHDVLIITRDVSAYDDYVPERAKQLQQIAMSSLSGSAGQGPAAKRMRSLLYATVYLCR